MILDKQKTRANSGKTYSFEEAEGGSGDELYFYFLGMLDRGHQRLFSRMDAHLVAGEVRIRLRYKRR